MPETKRPREEVFVDLEKLEKQREQLDKQYFKRSEEMMDKWDELMAELKD